MNRSVKRNVLLEYCQKGHNFHYNVDLRNGPNDDYHPLGWASTVEADVFTTIIYPLISEGRFDDQEIPFAKVKKSFERFCEMIEDDIISLRDYYDTTK